jgi:TPR repeat protein
MNNDHKNIQRICQTLATCLLVLLFLFATVSPVLASFEDGLAASQKGDYSKALHEFRILAENGHAKAQLQLGILYEMGLGVKKDYQQASKWYQKAAIQGDSEAQKRFLEMKKKGRSDFMPPPTPENFTGDMTDPQVQYDLGVMYFSGIGVKKDLKTALRWFEMAAHQGHPRAQNDLAVMLLKGKGIDKPNSAKAYVWFLRAAEQNFADAQFNLGLLLTEGTGQGIPRHFPLAYMWLEIAAQNGLLEARNRQVMLAKNMKEKEILAAKKQASHWLSQQGIKK